MDPGERQGWLKIIGADDLDTHLAKIGQAQVNAGIKREMFSDYPLQPSSKLLIAGCGTAQFCDFIDPREFGEGIELTLADFNVSYLERCRERLQRFCGLNYRTVEDDIEATRLNGPYDAVLIALVLQHVEWRKALDSMISTDPNRFYIIIQEQDYSRHAVTKSRDDLSPALQRYAQVANPKLVPRNELVDFLDNKGYSMLKIYEREVPNDKVMCGLVFQKR